MYKLIIPKNRSKNFPKAVDCAILMGGTFDGEKIVIESDEYLHLYEFFKPILKFNVTNWVGTKAYYNGIEVDPYRFMFDKHISIRTAINMVRIQLDKSEPFSQRYVYYKREGNTFFFKNKDFNFDMQLKGKKLYEMLENHEIGDVFFFPEMYVPYGLH